MPELIYYFLQIWRLRRLLQKPENATASAAAHHPIVDNFRPYQQLRNRVIYCSHPSLAGVVRDRPRDQPGQQGWNGPRSLGVPRNRTRVRKVEGVSVQVQAVHQNNVTGERRVQNSGPVPIARFSSLQHVEPDGLNTNSRVINQQQTIITRQEFQRGTPQLGSNSRMVGRDNTRKGTAPQIGGQSMRSSPSFPSRDSRNFTPANTARSKSGVPRNRSRNKGRATTKLGPMETKAILLPSHESVPDYSIHVVPGENRVRLHIPLQDEEMFNGESEVSAVEVHPDKGLFKFTLDNQQSKKKDPLPNQSRGKTSPEQSAKDPSYKLISNWNINGILSKPRQLTTRNQQMDTISSIAKISSSEQIPNPVASRKLSNSLTTLHNGPARPIIKSDHVFKPTTPTPFMNNMFGKSVWFVTPFGEPMYDLHRVENSPFRGAAMNRNSGFTTSMPFLHTDFLQQTFEGRAILDSGNGAVQRPSVQNSIMNLFPFFESPVRIRRPFDAALRASLSKSWSHGLSNGFDVGMGESQISK